MKWNTVVVGTALAFGLVAAQAATVSLQTPQDKVSYAMGVETGKAFKTHDVKINPKAYAQGMQDAMSGGKKLMTDAAIKQTLATFQERTIAKMQTKLKQASVKNQQLGAAFLAANKNKPGVKVTASGLQYKIITKGTGPQPTKNDTVVVNYEGKLINGKVFDSSYKRGKPTTFPVAGVIPGWQEGLMMMHQGGVWQLFIPAKLAYGMRGAPGAIGPNETLIFKVQLLKVKKS